MTYALSWPLQQALHSAIAADAGCAAFFGPRIYDAAPPFGPDAQAEGLYLTIGDETVVDWSTATDRGARHQVTLTVYAPRHGYAEAKQAAAAVSDVLLDGTLAPERGRIVDARFMGARTRRAEGDALRRIEMRFSIVLEDTV
jgi:hypothetical protein